MIRRILNSRLPLMIYNPVKVFDVKYFNTIYTSGALPVLDTEFLTDEEIIQRADQLTREKISFGIRLSDHDPVLINKLGQKQMINLDLLIVPIEKDDKPADFDGFPDTKIVLEVKDINIQDKIKAIDPHALVLRGNEAGGKVSRYSSFILMQWYLKNSDLPVFIHGGVGKYTAAGMFAAGVSGLVLDTQVLMTDDAPVSDNFKKLLAMVDESDSTEISYNEEDTYRVFAKLGTKIVKDLKQKAVLLADEPNGRERLYREISKNMTAAGNEDAQFIQSLFYLGQDGIFAKDFVKDTSSLKEIVETLFKNTGAFTDNINI